MAEHSVGEITATLRLKDELTAQLNQMGPQVANVQQKFTALSGAVDRVGDSFTKVKGGIVTSDAAIADANAKWEKFQQTLVPVQDNLGKVNKLAEQFSGAALTKQIDAWIEALSRANGVMGLTQAEQKKLNDIVTETKAKYEALGETVVKSQFGEQAITNVNNLGHALESVGFKSDEAGGKTINFATSLRTAFEHPLESIQKLSGSIGEGIGSALDKIGPEAAAASIALAATAGAVVLLGKAWVDMAEQAAAAGEKISDLSDRTGIAVPAMSNLAAAVTAAGGSSETAANAIFTMQERMETAGAAGDKVRTAIEGLGLSFDEFKQKSPDQQLLAISDGLRAIPPGAERASAAFEIFGRQGRELLPTLLKPLSDLTAESERLGLTWTEQDAAAAEEFGIKSRLLDESLSRLKDKIGIALLPVLTELLDGLEKSGGILEGVGHAADGIREALEGLLNSLRVVETLFGTLGRTAKAGIADVEGLADVVFKIAREAFPELGAAYDAIRAKFAQKGPGPFGLTLDQIADVKKELPGVAALIDGIDAKQPPKDYWDFVNTGAQELKNLLEGINAELDKQAGRATIPQVNQPQLFSFQLPAEPFGGQNPFEIPTDGLDEMTRALKAAQEGVKNLTDEQKRAIESGQALGKSAEFIHDKTGIAVDIIKQFEKGLQSQSKAAKDSSKDTDAFERSVQGLIDKFSGQALQRQIDGIAEAVRRMNAAGQQIPKEQLQQLHDLLQRLVQEGGKLPPVLDGIATANLHLRDTGAPVISSIKALTDSLPIATQAALGIPPAFDSGTISAKHLFDVLSTTGNVTSQVKGHFADFTQGLKDADKQARETDRSLQFISTSLHQLGQNSGSEFVKGFSLVFDATVNVTNGIESIQKAWHDLTSESGGFNVKNLSALAAGWIGVAVAAYQVGVALAGHVQKLHQISNASKDVHNEMADLVDKNRNLSTGLATDIAGLAEQLKKLDSQLGSAGARHFAELLLLDKIIAEQGGLTEKNLSAAIRQAERLFEVIARGGQLGQQAVDELTKLIGQFAAQAEKTGGLWSDAFKELIGQAKAAGVAIDDINKLIAGQQEKLGKSTIGITLDTGGNAAKFADLTKQINESKDALAKLIDEGADIKDIELARAKLAKLQHDISAVAVTSQDEFDRLSRLVFTAFGTLVASGVDVVSAIEQIGPAIDNLIASADAFGLSGNAAFDELKRWKELVDNNQPLLDQVSGLNGLLVTLANLGGLTQSAFNDLEAQAESAFTKLTAAGFTEQEALVQIVPFLQNVIKLHKDKGLAIDEATQKLIDQATEQGLLDDKQLTTNDILVQGFSAILKALGVDIPDAWKTSADKAAEAAKRQKDELDKVAKAGEDAAKRTGSAFDNLDIKVPVHFDAEGFPNFDGFNGGNAGPNPPNQSAANEGFFRVPTTVRVGDDPQGQGEYVLHKATVDSLIAAANGGGFRPGASQQTWQAIKQLGQQADVVQPKVSSIATASAPRSVPASAIPSDQPVVVTVEPLESTVTLDGVEVGRVWMRLGAKEVMRRGKSRR